MSTERDVCATGWRTNAVRSAKVQTVRRDGREYLQFPLVPLTEMVLAYPENGTKEYLPAESIRETADLWDGTLLTYVHPENRNRTVRDPDAFMGDVIGAFHDPEVLDGGAKLRGTGLVDVQKADALGGQAAALVELLQDGEQVSVSAGYATMDDEFRSGRFDGEQYDMVQGPPLPDHIAVFPSDSAMRARCSPADGCAAPKANAYQDGQGGRPPVQRANSGVSATMSDRASNDGSTVFPTEDERQAAIETIQQELPSVGPEIRRNDDRDLLLVAQGVGYSLPECECDGTCDCPRTNAGGQSRSQANLAGVPGAMNRNYDDTGRNRGENAEGYPAGSRQAWERRQVGLEDVQEDDEYPTGRRSDWEARQAAKRRANSDSPAASDDGGSFPTGSRSSYKRRRNAGKDAEAKPWLAADYPLSAKRDYEEREERRRRREKLKEQAKRNDARLKYEQEYEQ
jgi:hypothetical protein